MPPQWERRGRHRNWGWEKRQMRQWVGFAHQQYFPCVSIFLFSSIKYTSGAQLRHFKNRVKKKTKKEGFNLFLQNMSRPNAAVDLWHLQSLFPAVTRGFDQRKVLAGPDSRSHAEWLSFGRKSCIPTVKMMSTFSTLKSFFHGHCSVYEIIITQAWKAVRAVMSQTLNFFFKMYKSWAWSADI